MSFNVLSLFITGIASFILGAFVYQQDRTKQANLSLMLLSVSVSAWCFGQAFGEIVAAKDSVLFWTRFNLAGAIFIPALYFLFVSAFLGLTKSNRRMIIAFFAAAFLFLAFDLTPLFVKDIAPQAAYRFYPVPGPAYYLFPLYFLLVLAVGFYFLIKALRGPAGAKRNQAWYVFIASILGFGGGATAFFPVFNIPWPSLAHYFVPLYLIITVYAIVKHKLLDINVVIREGLVYSALTVLFAGFYALMILSAERVFQNIGYFNEFSAMLIAVFVSVIVFQPLRDRIQQVVDRLFFKGRYYYEKTINDLSDDNRKLYESLLRADKLASLGTLAAGMAHEIKNPLASLKGMTQILPENLTDSKFIKDYVEMVPRSLDRINSIVEKLLKAGKIQKPEKKKIDLNEIIKEALGYYKSMCLKQGIEVNQNLSSLPKIAADPEQAYQVFSNIIQNAVQAMPDGGSLNLKTAVSGDRIMVEISDTGGGIPEDKLTRVFDPFFSLKEGGSGLGLFTAYRIIQNHGGTIEVSSATGKGTVFKIWLYTRPRE